MTQFNTTIQQTDSEALGKLLSLMERDALKINDPQTETPDTHSTHTSGTTALFNRQDAAVTLTRTKLYSTEIAEMEVSLGSLSLADLSEVLNLNPNYDALYALLGFSDVTLYARASERDDYEYLTLQGTVLSGDEGLWDFLGITAMPLKELALAVTVTHKKGSFRKNHQVAVGAKLTIDSKDINVEINLPVGNQGLWSLKLLTPEVGFSLPGLAKLVMGSDAFSHLPQPVQNIPGFTLSSLNINFDPVAARVHDIRFGLHSAGAWNILPGGADGSVLALQDIGLAFTMRWDGDSSYSYQGQVNGTAHIGSLDIAAVIPIPLTGLMTLQVNSTKPLPSLGEFTQLLGGNALADYLPDGLSDSFSMDINRLRLVIDLDEGDLSKKLKEFELAIATPPKDPDDQDAPAWPIWKKEPPNDSQYHLVIDSFDLYVKLRHANNSWQVSGSINGRGLIENTSLGNRIEKPEAGPWKIALTEPLVFSTGLSSITNLTGIDLQTTDNNVLPAGINDISGFGIALRNFQLHLQDTTPTIPFLAVYIETQGTLEIVSGLSLVQAAVIMEMQSPFVTEDRSITGQIGGKIQIGEHQISLVSSKNDEHTGWIFQGSSALGDAISLTSLLHTLLNEVNVTLPSIFPDVSISDLELSYTPSLKHLTFKGTSEIAVTNGISAKFTVDLDYQSGVDSNTVFNGTGAIRIGNAVFYLTTGYDSSNQQGWTFTANTSDTIVLSELLREVLAYTPLALPAVLPLSLSVSDVSFESTPKVHYYALDGTASLALNISNFSLALNVVLQLLRPASPSPDAPPEKLQIDLEATADLLIAAGTSEEVALQLTGSYHSNGEGWLFRGSSAPGQEIFIHTLIDDLATKFGINPSLPYPQPLDTLSFKDLAIAFNTQSKDFSFSGAMDFQVNNVPVDFKTQLRITHRQDGTPQTVFSGTLSLGTTHPKLFDLIFNSDTTSNLMLAGYHSVNGDTVSIADLAGSVLGISVPDVLSFTLKDAVLAYDADEAAKNVLLTAHMGNGLDLSRLPLVGKLFSEGAELTLNYQITAASGAFDAPVVAAINSLLPEGIGSLNDQAIPQGLGVSATMNFAGDILSFDLPLAVNDDTTGTPDPVQLDPASPAAADDSMKWINLQKTFGPVHFNRIGIQYEDNTLTFVLDASFTVAGLTIGLDGLSVSSPLTKFTPVFDLKGISIDFKNGPLEIGASFLREHIGDPSPGGYDEYSGLAILKMGDLSLSAIGSYAYVNGHPSLFIYAVLNYPLGGPSFFFVTGLSAGFGYNRALRMPPIDKVLEFPLVAEALNGKSLPANAGKEVLVQELEAIHSYIPPATGQFFVAVGLSFTTFKLIDSTVLVAVSFGNRFELDLLGVSTLTVPPEAPVTPLAMIQMTLKGAFIPDEGFAGLQGQLTPASYILSKDCHLTGGFAFYSWYKGEHSGDFVTTIGGYHPHFKVPAHYPTVPRLAFNWRLDSHTHIKGDMYFALCAHALMAGGHLEATYEKGALKAWFKAGADFLVAWKPYHYEASAYVNIGCSYTYHFFGTHHINIDVSAYANIWGPEFGGHAKVDLRICSIGVDIGAPRISAPDPVSWDEFNSTFLPQDGLCTITAVDGLVTKGPDEDHLGVVNPKELVILTDAFIPSKTVSWGSTGIDNTGDVNWTSGFGIGPMGIAANDLTCSQTVTIEKYQENTTMWSDHTTHFNPVIKTKKAPAGMWGEQLHPGVNDPQFIENTFSGLEIVPGNDTTPVVSSLIDKDFVQFETSPISNAISWETRESFVAFAGNEAILRSIINNSITSNATERNALLASLDIDATIDLTDSIADDYSMAPQVMAPLLR